MNSPPSPLTPIVKINKIGIKKYMSIYRFVFAKEIKIVFFYMVRSTPS